MMYDKRKKETVLLEQTAAANHHSQTAIIGHNTDLSQEREIVMIKLSSVEFFITCRSSISNIQAISTVYF